MVFSTTLDNADSATMQLKAASTFLTLLVTLSLKSIFLKDGLQLLLHGKTTSMCMPQSTVTASSTNSPLQSPASSQEKVLQSLVADFLEEQSSSFQMSSTSFLNLPTLISSNPKPSLRSANLSSDGPLTERHYFASNF